MNYCASNALSDGNPVTEQQIFSLNPNVSLKVWGITKKTPLASNDQDLIHHADVQLSCMKFKVFQWYRLSPIPVIPKLHAVTLGPRALWQTCRSTAGCLWCPLLPGLLVTAIFVGPRLHEMTCHINLAHSTVTTGYHKRKVRRMPWPG